MIYNYIKVIVRNFAADKLYSAIIILGLAIGLSVCLMIAQYIHFETSFDKQYTDADRICYAYMKFSFDDLSREISCHPAVAPLFKRAVAGAEDAGRMVPLGFDKGGSAIIRWKDGDNKSYGREDELYFADAEILDIFSIPLLKGNAENSLHHPYTVILTEGIADKIFTGIDPINEVVEVQIYGSRLSFVVTGVVADPPPNSSIQFRALFSMKTVDAQWTDQGSIDEVWIHPIYTTFIKLGRGVDARDVEVEVNRAGSEPLSRIQREYNLKEEIHLIPFTDFHFYRFRFSDGTMPVTFSGDMRLVNYFAVLAAIVLFISWANHVNLTTARAIQRAKEIGLRKVNGASRHHIITQLLVEFFIMNTISLLLALTVTQLLFNTFAAAIGSSAKWHLWQESSFWAILLLFLGLSTLISGIYPAFVMSGYNPLRVLKGNFGRSRRGVSIRNGLVIVQFVLSVFLITCIYMVGRQLSFLMNKDRGFSTEQVMVIQNLDLDTAIDRTSLYGQFRAMAGQLSAVRGMSATSAFPGSTPGTHMFKYGKDGSTQELACNTWQISGGYFNTMDMSLIAGRDFIDDQPGEEDKIIITEYTARLMGFAEPSDAVGTIVSMVRNETEYEVIGIVKDFVISRKVPMVLGDAFIYKTWGSEYYNYFLVNLETAGIEDAIAYIRKQWPGLTADSPFEYFFLDTYFDTMYREEERFAGVFAFFSIVGIAVTCMGLFGLSLYNTGSRAKEIGIRKSLGSSAGGIMWLFSKEYIRLVAAAVIVGMPFGLWGVHAWLSGYPNRVAITADALIIPPLIAIFVALITVGYHTYRIAHLNPVQSLRAD